MSRRDNRELHIIKEAHDSETGKAKQITVSEDQAGGLLRSAENV